MNVPTDIVLTFDFFLRDWSDPTPEKGELWICVQPHVIEGAGAARFTAMEDWIRSSAAGRAFTYRMASPSMHSSEFIPVNFCDDVNVALAVTRGGARTSIVNQRRNRVQVKDAAAAADIAAVNRERGDERVQEASPVAAIPPGPFAAGYNHTLRDAFAAQPSLPEKDRITSDHFSQMLKVAFWGGTRRYIPTSAIVQGGVTLMALPESEPSLLVTNLHSLCGLLFRVGTRADLASSQQITDIQVVLDNAAGPLAVAGHDANATASIGAFFSKLPATIPVAQQPSATWDAAAATRVYTVENFAALSHQPKLTPSAWYRRQSESAATAQHRLLSRLRRLVLRFDEAEEKTPSWPRLHWQAWDAFDVKVVPYRRYPASRAANAPAPLQVQPAPADRKRFYDELKKDPQLFTRGDARLVDAAGVDHAAALRYVGAFDFPWDHAAGELAPASCPPSTDVTVILHGPIPPQEALTLLIPRRDNTGAAIVFETTRSADDDTFGPRWEQAVSSNLDLHFTHLVCTDLPDAAKANRLEPALAFDRDYRFEFAQAASSIEGTVTATFPHGVAGALTDPNAVDPIDEYAHDLVNHNAINVYAQWGGTSLENEKGAQLGRKPGHLNPYGQIYPIASAKPNGTVEYTIPFRHRLDPKAPRPKAPVRPFFKDMHSRIGAPRTLSFDFEHTYGTQMKIPIDGHDPIVTGLSSHYDFDLLTPPEVTRASEPGPGCPPTTAFDFMTVTYQHVPNGREILRFTLQTQWLNSVYASCGEESMRATHVAAWRAIAELAFASQVRVTGLFRRFDFHAALSSCDTDGIAAGLTPVDAFEKRVWVVAPDKLSVPCGGFLDVDAFPDVYTFEVVLTEPAERPKVFESCNVIEIFLTTERDPQRLAPLKAWRFVAPAPQTGADPLGIAANEVQNAKDVFDDYLKSIASKTAVVHPQFADPQQESDAARFRRLLGNGLATDSDAVARRQSDPGAWILPEGVAVAAEGSVVPSVCPLTFRAPALDPLLGPMTFELLRKYFQLLQVIIDCDFDGATALAEGQWREHFALLDATARALGQSDSLFDAALDSVIAVPNVDPTAGIDAEVRAAAVALRDRTSAAAMAMRRWLQHALWREPAMFADAKALLFHRLRPATGTVAPADFFAIESTRNISEQDTAEPGNATFRQSLVDLQQSPWFGIAEVLDDIRYDNDFTFDSYRLRSFEGVVTDAAAGNGRLEVPIDHRTLHLPAGTQNLDDVQTAKTVQLASRAPVVPPTHLFSGMVAELQDVTASANLRNRRLSLANLKQGKVVDARGNEAAVRVAGATAVMGAQPRLDEYVLTTLYAIHGDEEMENAWRSAFDNDEIHIHKTEPKPDDSAPAAAASSASSDIATLFAGMANASHMHQAKVAPKLAVSAEAMAFVTRILRTTPQAPPDTLVPALQIMHHQGSGDCVDMALQFPAGDALTGRLQAVFFAAAPDGIAPCDESVPRTTFVLMLNAIVPVWKPAALGIVHARNVRKVFAPDIAQITAVVLPDRFHQPFVSARGPALTLARRPYSLREIVAAFALADVDESHRHDVSVTVSHWQRRAFPASAGAGEESAVNQESSFPLANAVQQTSTSSTIEFDPDYDDFLLDLQWSSDTNLQFFRINECRVRLTP
jgi:hypothetical protein